MRKRKQILVIATSKHTHGGITSVIKLHQRGSFWQDYNMCWIETHSDKNNLYKIIYFIRSFFQYLIFLPQAKLVHIHTSFPPSLIRKLFYFFPAKILHKKTIIHLHCSPEVILQSKLRKIYCSVLENCDTSIVLSNKIKSCLIKKFQIKNSIIVVENPISIPNKPLVKQNIILYAGILNKHKGYSLLIHAFSKIANKFPDWSVIFAGNGEIDKAKLLAKKLGCSNQIKFEGWVSGAAKDKLFTDASIFCLPSFGEGLPMSVLEAWSYNIAVLCTPVGGLPDVVNDKQNALYITVGSSDDIAEKLTFLIEHEEERIRIANAGYECVKNRFDVNVINKQVESIYKKLLQ